MKKYGIIYGSATGSTESVAQLIGKKLGIDSSDIINVRDAAPDNFDNYDVLVLGTSTWGDGEMQEDWYDMIAGVEVLDLKGKQIALFGCGDENMSDTFCNGVGELYHRLKNTGAEFIAPFNADCYNFNESSAFIDGKYIGLLLDEVNKPEMTVKRVSEWTDLIKAAN